MPNNTEFSKININVNQNVIVLIIGLVALAYSELNKLPLLLLFSLIISVVMTIFVLISMNTYTWHYINKKLKGIK